VLDQFGVSFGLILNTLHKRGGGSNNKNNKGKVTRPVWPRGWVEI
jgi:hypothetical protein